MSKSVCNDRLRKEYAALMKKPLEHIIAAPRESDILTWHYCIVAPKGSVYEGGYYHGTVTFPPTYPFKPPSIQMLTPSGRFKVQTRLCLSMSDFHPETWNPMWSVGTILMGLFSFFLEDTPTHGSIVTSDAVKRRAAQESLAYNCRDKVFCELFPELAEKFNASQQLMETESTSMPLDSSKHSKEGVVGQREGADSSWVTIVSLLIALVGCLLTFVFYFAV